MKAKLSMDHADYSDTHEKRYSLIMTIGVQSFEIGRPDVRSVTRWRMRQLRTALKNLTGGKKV